jgi:hypothetical protein
MLCLAKILRHQQYFDSTVISRANECISILKYPRYYRKNLRYSYVVILLSIASSILDAPQKTGKRLSHVDENSSLPFLLETNIDRNPSSHPLHAFVPPAFH